MLKRIQVEREARAYVVIGEWEKAIALYRELLEESEDPNIYNLIGDVYVRMNNLNDALPEYLRAIDLYETEGLFENGIAVCKKALRLIPGYTELYFNLAVFYAEIGLLNEAAEAFKHYLQSSSKKKGPIKKPAHYRKLVSLLSSDQKLKAEVEEYYKKSNIHDNELDSVFLTSSDIETDTPTTPIEEQSEPIIEKIVTPEPEKPQNIPKKVQKPDLSSLEPSTPPVKKGAETPPISELIPSYLEPDTPPVKKKQEIPSPGTIPSYLEPDTPPVKKRQEIPSPGTIPSYLEPDTPPVKKRQEIPAPENIPSYLEPDTPPVKKEHEIPIPVKTNIQPKTKTVEDIPKPTATKKAASPTKSQDDDTSIENEKEFQLLLHAMNELKAATISPQKRDHYKIGLEYKNLGFYDAAIKEFQLSTSAQQERLKSLKELGYCFLKKAKPDVAINAFSRALEEENKSNDDYYTLKYGLAVAYETLGYTEKAIAAFEEIYLYNIDYLDVRDHLKKLKAIA